METSEFGWYNSAKEHNSDCLYLLSSVSSMTSAQSVAGPAPPSTEQASTSSHLSTVAVAATNEQQNLLQSKVMVAVRRGYIGVLDHIKKSLQKDFNFSFRHNLIKVSYKPWL